MATYRKVCLLLLLLVGLVATQASSLRAQAPRVVILAFDGADPNTVERLMAEGKLPNLSALADQGTFRPLTTTKPSESPVAWASFATGTNPGKTRIFDFLNKKPTSYIPGIALVEEGTRPLIPETSLRVAIGVGVGIAAFLLLYLLLGVLLKTRRALALGLPALVGLCLAGVATYAILAFLPKELPIAIRARQGDAFWKHTASNGIATVALQAPMEFPAEETANARVLTGFGTPDIRRTWGLWSLYTTDLLTERPSETGGTLYPLDFVDGRAVSLIRGPRNITIEGKSPPEVEIPLTLSLNPEKGRLGIEVERQSVELGVGEWSDWVMVDFRLNPIVKLAGTVRFYLLSLEPNVELYMEPINWDPKKMPPNVRISNPPGFAAELVDAVGYFETIGWKIATNPLRDDAIDFAAMIADAKFAMENDRKILLHTLDEDDWRCLVSVFLFTDRIQHMLYRFIDPEHPNYDAELAGIYGGGIEQAYLDMDGIVGQVMDRIADTDTTLMVVSDHGFHSFRKQFNVNTWLAQAGYMSASGESDEQRLENLFDPDARFFNNVDWSRTKAFALGLSGIYLNIAGRERAGIVAPGAEAEEVKQAIMKDLLDYKDPETGVPVVVEVHKREDIYSGPFVEEAPDLVLGLQPSYRIGWQSTLGGIPSEAVTPNLDNWSGDHCSMVNSPGIFFANKSVDTDAPNIIDVAPTVLSLFGIPVPGDMDGKSLMK